MIIQGITLHVVDLVIGERERANLVVQLARFFYIYVYIYPRTGEATYRMY